MIGEALQVDAGELLAAAGRPPDRQTFEETVMRRPDALGRDVRELKDAVKRSRGESA